MDIRAALASLDKNNDDLWTADDMPRLDLLSEMVGEKVTRKMAIDAWPEFTREIATGAPDAKEEIKEAEAIKEEVTELSDEEILKAEPKDMGMELPVLDAWMNAATRKQHELSAQIEELNKEMSMWARRADIVERVRERARKMDVNADKAPIRSFLENQKKAREEKAERARRFLEAGTTVEDVAKQLSGKSPIDRALGNRKSSQRQRGAING